MRIITPKPYKVYKYNELKKDIQHKVINDQVKWILECIPYEELSDNMKKAIDKSEKMQTPWFAGSYIVEYAMNEIISMVAEFEYLKDGSIY